MNFTFMDMVNLQEREISLMIKIRLQSKRGYKIKLNWKWIFYEVVNVKYVNCVIKVHWLPMCAVDRL